MRREENNLTFSKFYLFTSEAKMTFGLFYSYTIFMYLFLGWLAKAPIQSIDFVMGMQMMVLNIVIGFAQRILIPQGHVTVSKSIIWGVFSTLASLGTALVFGWFRGFPFWCPLVFFGILIVGNIFMIVHLHLKLETETRVLNEQLRKFQAQAGTKKGNAL